MASVFVRPGRRGTQSRLASRPAVHGEASVPAAVERLQRRRGWGAERCDQVSEERVLPSAYDRIADDVARAHALKAIHQLAGVRKVPDDLAGIVDSEVVVHRQADRLPI